MLLFIKKTIIVLGLLCVLPAYADNKPLLQDGKKTLYQRILSSPSCNLVAEPKVSNGKKIPAFSRFYIYKREKINNKEWLQVGPDAFGKTTGWLDSTCTIAWNTQMALVFTNPADRDRLLFFKNRTFLEDVISADKPEAIIKPIRSQLASTGKSKEVLAQEPEEFIDFKKNFYLLPILQGQEVMNSKGFYERILEVASITKDKPKADNKGAQKDKKQSITGFSAGVVFVIDTTITMDPYIERTKQAVEKFYKQVEKDGLGKQVKFGLVAYRSSTKATPRIEYTAKMYVNPNTVKSSADFMKKVESLKQATVSTHEFDEDAYAGVDEALKNINWDSFGGRYLVLITDAGALDGDNKWSSTRMNAKQLRLEAEEKGIATYVLHLKTDLAVKNGNYPRAAEQYNTLSFNKILNKPLYYTVDAKNIQQFGTTVDQLTKALISQVKLSYKGEMAAGSALGVVKKSTSVNNLEADAALLGRAMQLAYLGNVHNAQAPPLFKAWISDKDFVKSNAATAEARVLMTKAQLSDLSDVVKKIADAASSGLISPNDMFAQLRSIAAAMGQDPAKLKQTSTTKIADLGLLGEYLDNIPYKSLIASIDEDTWKSMGGLEQEKFIRELHSKLRHYKVYNADVDRWISLSEGSDKRDDVYPVPLEALP